MKRACIRKLRVPRQKVVQVRCAGSWVAQNDERLRVQRRRGDAATVQQPVEKGRDAVDDRHERQKHYPASAIEAYGWVT